MKRVAVIGGGAAGMIAALFASENCRVTLFEKESKLGRKVGITGNGRCNITNRNINIKRYHGKNVKVLHNIFGRFGLAETISFFESRGLPLRELKEGKLYPYSLQASAVVSFFEYELKRSNVEVIVNRRVGRIEKSNDKFRLTDSAGESHTFDYVVIACGGASYKAVGGSRSGYELAHSLDLKVTELFPAILPLNAAPKKLHKLEGIKWDVALSVKRGEKTIGESTGELLFTKYGISGPVTLDISRCVNESIMKGAQCEVYLDLFPEMSEDELYNFISKLAKDSERPAASLFEGILKKRMPEVFLEFAGIEHSVPAKWLKESELKKIVSTFKSCRVTPGEMRGFDEAVVTAGGVDIDEIDPKSMESKKVKGLYLAGEVLDIDGDSGGFNLQFAWSSGAVAGISISSS